MFVEALQVALVLFVYTVVAMLLGAAGFLLYRALASNKTAVAEQMRRKAIYERDEAAATAEAEAYKMLASDVGKYESEIKALAQPRGHTVSQTRPVPGGSFQGEFIE